MYKAWLYFLSNYVYLSFLKSILFVCLFDLTVLSSIDGTEWDDPQIFLSQHTSGSVDARGFFGQWSSAWQDVWKRRRVSRYSQKETNGHARLDIDTCVERHRSGNAKHALKFKFRSYLGMWGSLWRQKSELWWKSFASRARLPQISVFERTGVRHF